MKMILILIVVALLGAAFAYAGLFGKKNDATKRIESLLSSLPEGIKVVHTPSKVFAQEDCRSGRKYTWLHETSVSSMGGRIEIEEFGTLVWHNGDWVFSTIYGRPFNQKEFEEWYVCPQGILVPGKEFKDEANYTGGDVLRGSKSKWYFIGKNEEGKRVKGEAVVESLPEVTKGEQVR